MGGGGGGGGGGGAGAQSKHGTDTLRGSERDQGTRKKEQGKAASNRQQSPFSLFFLPPQTAGGGNSVKRSFNSYQLSFLFNLCAGDRRVHLSVREEEEEPSLDPAVAFVLTVLAASKYRVSKRVFFKI